MIADWWFAVGDVVVVLTTVPAGGKGEEIAQALVEERLAARVNILAPYLLRRSIDGAAQSNATPSSS